MVRARPCIVCGRRNADGAARCELHKQGSGRLRPCLVCARPSQGNYCAAHEPTVDEAARNERNPYRKHYRDPAYARNRQHRFERARGRCEACGVHVETGEWECDHLIPLRQGGTHDITNLRVLCIACHRAKTAEDRSRPRFI